MKLYLFLALISLAACSFQKNPLENQTLIGHTELYSMPSVPKNQVSIDLKRLVIVATNDLHAHYRPVEIIFKDKHYDHEQKSFVGGVDYISSYIKIIREQFGEILLLDSGDIFSDNAKELNYVHNFYDSLKYDGITIGLRDFNLKLPKKYKNSSDFLKQFSSKSKTPLLMSNLYELKTAKIVEWPGTMPYVLKEINGIKVGLIGLIPDDIVDQTPVDNRVGLFVESMLQSTLRHSRHLRSQGAQVIVVMTHQGISCGEELANDLKLPLSKVNFEPRKYNICNFKSALGEYLNRLPPNLVDVVIGGRNHQKTVNFLNTTLVLSNTGDGQSFTMAEFFVDQSGKIAKDKTIAHQPVNFCHDFFKETNDCYTEDQSIDHNERIPATFMGRKIKPDISMQELFKQFFDDKSAINLNFKNEIPTIVDFHAGNIAYYNLSSGTSKLVVLSIKGSDLLKILEHDYNQGLAANWRPSPFKEEGNNLILSIEGSSIENDEIYKVLADLDDLQKHQELKKFISKSETVSLNNVSWIESGIHSDNITSTMAASDTVR